jgi:hypothetical protein
MTREAGDETPGLENIQAHDVAPTDALKTLADEEVKAYRQQKKTPTELHHDTFAIGDDWLTVVTDLVRHAELIVSECLELSPGVIDELQRCLEVAKADQTKGGLIGPDQSCVVASRTATGGQDKVHPAFDPLGRQMICFRRTRFTTSRCPYYARPHALLGVFIPRIGDFGCRSDQDSGSG